MSLQEPKGFLLPRSADARTDCSVLWWCARQQVAVHRVVHACRAVEVRRVTVTVIAEEHARVQFARQGLRPRVRGGWVAFGADDQDRGGAVGGEWAVCECRLG